MEKNLFKCLALLVCLILGWNRSAMAQVVRISPAESPTAYLFVYFTGRHESIYFATSPDGYNYKALNNNQPVISPDTISASGGVRDPHILRSPDGKKFFMVATDMNVAKNGWTPNYGMVLMQSSDLVNWSNAAINIVTTYKKFSDVNRVWAPQTIYDPKKKKYMLYWSMRSGNGTDKIYYAYANKSFTALETAPELLFTNPTGGSCIDGDIILKDGVYHLFYKTEGDGNGIKQAMSKSLAGPFKQVDRYLQQTKDPVEGSSVFKLNSSDKYIMMYDVYTKGRYEFTESADLEHFKKVDHKVSMNFKPRHGTILPVTASELQRLESKWPRSGNPVLGGFFADPEILYARKTGKYYLYPTSDGFNNWSGDRFRVFSSDDLINWTDGGEILNLPTDVPWAKTNAWAPCIIEKQINGAYKYFYYFTAGKKIGVAVADDPLGPFKDSGKPLLENHPEGIRHGQVIDPDVFTDPVSGKSYLYWGNGYMAGAELNEDMVSLKPGTTKILTPDSTYNEGTYVIFRNGKYYFMWSENDTRSEDYRVRYAVADQPLGKLTVPDKNLVIAKRPTAGIYGTGHHSILQISGKDEWYIVYHRFQFPDGIKMGSAAGFNREVCIDKIEFAADGSIIQVTPTHTSILPLTNQKNK